MECVRRIITIILAFEFKLYIEYQAKYWPSKFYKKSFKFEPRSMEIQGSWVRFSLWLQANIIYTRIPFQLGFPMAQELYANSVFYRNEHRYTVVRGQPNWAIWPKSHLLRQIIDTWSSRMNSKLFWLFFAQKIL